MGLHPFLAWLLYSSLMGSILIGLILIIRLVFKNRLGANWQYLIWFLLIVKLLMPYAPESSFSVFNLFNHVTIQALAGNYFESHGNEVPEPNPEKKSLVTEIVGITDDYSLSVDRTFLDSRNIFIFGIWFIGVLSLTAYTIYSTTKLRCTIQHSLKVNDCNLIKLLEECKQVMNCKEHPLLIESPVLQSPMVASATRPQIILPADIIDTVSRAELRFILLHELAHLQRKDLYINWITAFLQIIHWFNPLIWYAFHQMRQDRELACDAYVLSLLKPDEYKSYGSAIISFLERYSYSVSDYTIVGLASSKSHIKKRITMIASYKKETLTRGIWGILLLLLFGSFMLTNAKGTLAVAQAERPPTFNQNIVNEDLSKYFQEYNGTFVLLDMEKDQYQVYNRENSQKRVSPNSTYKIISSLVGLETGVLTDENSQLEWDGTIYPFTPWNKNQTLGSAITYSVNWYFQKVDLTVGKTRIENYLKQIGYGNYDLSADIHDFWIESSLKISPLEQVEMFKKLYTYEMPFSPKNIDIVKHTLKLSEQNNVALYGKTGTGIVNGNSINGWFVGYVESKGKVYLFATNIQGKERADGINAKNITLSILKAKNLL